MPDNIKLSELAEHIQQAIQANFDTDVYWISARVMNVKKYEKNRRCYLSLEEYENGNKITEMKAVFWANYYNEIEKFEKLIQQPFADGIEIICKVKVRFHLVYGLNLDVIQIDVAHTLGSLEIQRQQTLERLLKENYNTIKLHDGAYKTYNNCLPMPLVINNVALLTAPNSDGQRDFKQELLKNIHNYNFTISEFLTTIQGHNAHLLILEQLKLIEKSEHKFDAVAIVRGGGSQTDFTPFNNFELCQYVANFSIPILTGIGHDRNQNIIDLMVREQKTPTKVAALFVEHNFNFENRLIQLKNNFYDLVKNQIANAKDNLNSIKRIVKLASPQATLDRGFAIIMCNNKIITEPKNINANDTLQTILRNEIIDSTVATKTKLPRNFFRGKV